jgi:plastocyanin
MIWRREKIMKRLITLILLGLTALLLVACGGKASAAPNAAGDLTIEMKDFRFVTDDIQLKVGREVTFILDNLGEKDHELMIGRNILVEGGTTVGFEHDMFEEEAPMVMGSDGSMDDMEGMDMGGGEHDGFMLLVPTDSNQASMTFTVTADMIGEWEMACFQGNGSHYDDGMRGRVVVTQ